MGRIYRANRAYYVRSSRWTYCSLNYSPISSRSAGYNIQTFDAQSISDSTANEIADYFRTGFTAAPYFHFAFHESDPLQSLPHTKEPYSSQMKLI